MKMQVHHHAFSCHRGMLVKNEISQTIEDKRLTKSINRLQNMGMMSNDGICPRFCQSGGKHALAYRGLSLKFHSPMKYHDNPDIWPRGMIMLDCLCQLVSRRLAYARAFISMVPILDRHSNGIENSNTLISLSQHVGFELSCC